ncbi:hypothetical protein ERC79_13440 [Rhodococcus sp. ABRD24]|uniref:hypothetical protein n=1 Tax=Rhodococcus sp. ABRD24 TaxID=2507582 RepID=UPI00103CAC1F|nr:hypothetical protein [Rhodococcus sp. ABRD24]QBJ96843.1 hypothetical protein ERC79_13440 [Rhodococcus sp. ABRD24]
MALSLGSVARSSSVKIDRSCQLCDLFPPPRPPKWLYWPGSNSSITVLVASSSTATHQQIVSPRIDDGDAYTAAVPPSGVERRIHGDPRGCVIEPFLPAIENPSALTVATDSIRQRDTSASTSVTPASSGQR